MKKTVFQITVLALFLIMGCSKDDLMTTEQEPSSVEKNNLTANGERRGDGGVNGWNFTEFYGTSTGTDALTICLPDEIAEPLNLPGMDCGRKLLANGYFSGNLSGYGKINPSLSKYTIEFGEPYWEPFPYYNDADYYALYNDKSYTDRIEPYFYNIVITGTVTLSLNDSFKLTITGELSPMAPLLDVNTGIIKGSGFGTHDVVISDGRGKFKNYTQIFYNCGTTQIAGTNFQGANLEGTGQMSLYVNNIHF